MAKKESTFLNMVLTLFIVTLVSSAALGAVYEMTKGPKAAADLAKKTKAISEVVPEFDNQPLDEKYTVCKGDACLLFYPAKKGEQLVGTAVETASNLGYGGEIKLMVGLKPDGSVYNIVVVDHKETPGLGDKIDPAKSNFIEQFRGKQLDRYKLRVKKDAGDVDAITAATISSRAFCDAVQRAYDYHRKEQSH